MKKDPNIEQLLASIRQAIANDLGDMQKPVLRDETLVNVLSDLKERISGVSSTLAVNEEIRDLRNKIRKRQGPGTKEAEPARHPSQRREPQMGAITTAATTPLTRTPNFDKLIRSEAEASYHEPSPLLPLRPSSYDDSEFLLSSSSESDNEVFLPEGPSIGPTSQLSDSNASYRETILPLEPEQDESIIEEEADLDFVEPLQSSMPLMSQEPAAAAQIAFQWLAETVAARGLSDDDVERMTRTILTEMLRDWLDDHLPALVESIVREEVSRVSRRSR